MKNYKRRPIAIKAYKKALEKHSAFDKNLIKIDRLVNIIEGIFNGQLLKIFPKADDQLFFKNNTKRTFPTLN